MGIIWTQNVWQLQKRLPLGEVSLYYKFTSGSTGLSLTGEFELGKLVELWVGGA